ncbi:hypothetical protein DL546_009929 [Coniochaeta pulveracea]|uniref:Uncharacterized protein n=1 Tax=Coniochaeta pulveracea TaxID=177199 RepID=A0A420Y089_9PEZI|nr:hypothetical protein DL546_009929 [Coniochaeta pulveracea]
MAARTSSSCPSTSRAAPSTTADSLSPCASAVLPSKDAICSHHRNSELLSQFYSADALCTTTKSIPKK